MTLLAKAMLIVFIGAWCVAVGSWFYGTRYFMPMWLAGFRKRDEHKGYKRKVFIGYTIFISAIAVGFVAGGIAEYFGGGWE